MLEGCPNTAVRLAGWRRVIQQGVKKMDKKHRHELRTLVDPCLLSVYNHGYARDRVCVDKNKQESDYVRLYQAKIRLSLQIS
jgi:hypothetical protein